MRKKLLVVALTILSLQIGGIVKAGQFDVQTEKDLTYNVWCRHSALLWGSIVGEDKQVRVAIGWYSNAFGVAGWHAQPQVLLGENWYFFEMKAAGIKEGVPRVRAVIISMPKREGETWKLAYTMSWMQFALLHNSWMVQKEGKSWNELDKNKWSEELNFIVDRLRKLEKEIAESKDK